MTVFASKNAQDYDARIQKLVPGYDLIHEITYPLLKSLLPAKASLLVSGAGTGAELMNLATRELGWAFAAVDPSEAMLEHARERASQNGLEEKIDFFTTTLKDYPLANRHDGALSILVAHFFPDDGTRFAYFKDLHKCLKQGAPLLFADLVQSELADGYGAYAQWSRACGQTREQTDQMFARLADNFHPLDEQRLNELLQEAGFGPPRSFFQALDYKGYVTYCL